MAVHAWPFFVPTGNGWAMTKLAMQQAPAPSTPQRFLFSAVLWGVGTGGLLTFDGSAAFASRWAGPTLALTHMLALGFLGNAMLGSLLQFLPVAAGVRVHGGRGAALALHALFNFGVLLLVLALRWPMMLTPVLGGIVLLAAFALLATMLLPGLLMAVGQHLLRWGVGGALAAALLTAVLGLMLTLGVDGVVPLPLQMWTNVHAGWGVLGWVAALLAAVGRVVMPMFQGAAMVPVRAQVAWSLATYGLLLTALLAALAGMALPGLRYGSGLLGLAFALGGLLLQRRGARLRRVPLTYFWMAGLTALAVAALLLIAGGESSAVRVGVLVLGAGLPLLVTGMLLEISAFLGWIGLQRRCGRGVHLPGVQLLLPARDKALVLALHVLAVPMLLAATCRPLLAPWAGVTLVLAHLATGCALARAWHRAYCFVRITQKGACDD